MGITLPITPVIIKKVSKKEMLQLQTIIIDTREQKPYLFNSYNVNCIRQKLHTGDYSIVHNGIDYSNIITVERKSYADFLNSITNDRSRFEKECVRLKEIRFSYIIVECSLENILANVRDKGTVSELTVLNTSISWSQRYGIFFYFLNNRKNAESFIYNIFKMFIKNYINGNK